MDFFAQQDKARRNTWKLVLYFLLAVLLIVLAVNVFVYYILSSSDQSEISSAAAIEKQLDPRIWLYVSLSTLGVIFLGSLFRFLNLSGGGHSVADMVNARLVDLESQDVNEKEFIHVVEEMSIAAGIPMPTLYIMDREMAINAFVAGYKPTEAVMVITRGCLTELNRDELQSVVGHEFSHILNGDMRINIRLISILAGILAIGKVGAGLMALGFALFSDNNETDHSKKNDGAVIGIVMIPFGFALFVIGYIGLFFGRLIKAAISRQREFLADAASVQFTRNPKGLIGALYKIQKHSSGAFLKSSNAEEMSHMCFAGTIKLHFISLLATHPPIDVRINAVDATFFETDSEEYSLMQQQAQAKSVSEASEGAISQFSNAGSHTSVAELTASVGNPTPAHLDYAHELMESLPAVIHQKMHSKSGAALVIYGLLIADMDKTFGMEYSLRTNFFSEQDAPFLYEFHQLDDKFRLPLIEIVLPVLKQFTEDEKQQFINRVEQLIELDNQCTLFEFVILTLMKQQLNKNAAKPNQVKYHSLEAVQTEICLLISVLVQSSGKNQFEQSFQRAILRFKFEQQALVKMEDVNPEKIFRALNKLNLLSSILKKTIIDACVETVLDDDIIMPAEAELLRAISSSLDSPMPPLLPNEKNNVSG